jgi:hypothetical protein
MEKRRDRGAAAQLSDCRIWDINLNNPKLTVDKTTKENMVGSGTGVTVVRRT